MSKKSNRENVSVLPTGEEVYTPPDDEPPAGNGERAPAKPTETKREKFLRLARRRIPNAEKAILHVANLFRTAQYDCEERHLTATEKKLQKALDQCRANFATVKPKAPEGELFPEDNPPLRSA